MCRYCRRLSVIDEAEVCKDCVDSQEDKYHSVKDYLYDNKGATVSMVSDNCGVRTGTVMRWLREERIEVLENSKVKLRCARCDAEILSGSFCKDCKPIVERNEVERIKAKAPMKKMKVTSKYKGHDDKMRFF